MTPPRGPCSPVDQPATGQDDRRARPGGAARLAATLLLLAACALTGGCARNKPAAVVSLVASSDGRPFEQVFAAARYARSESGNYDIVLVDQTEGLSPVQKGPNKPLASADAAPLTHLMHVRVLWRPMRAIRAGSPSASNATVNWVVLSRDGGRLEYAGAGFARVFGGGDPSEPIRVQLSAVRLTPTQREGDLEDPVGACTLNTAFKAFPDASVVRTALGMIRGEDPTAPPSEPTAGAGRDRRSAVAAPAESGGASDAYRGPPPRPPGP